jgi:hypothetical protein
MVVLVIVALSAIAHAGKIVTIRYLGYGSTYTVDGIDYPTYPFYTTVNGASQWLMSIDSGVPSEGHLWSANALSVDDYGTYLQLIMGDPNGATKAHVLAYLYTLARSDGGQHPYINAVALFCNIGIPDIHGDPNAFALYDLVDDFDVSDFNHGEFADVVVYVKLEGESGDTLFGTTTTPEPSSLLMLGTGLLGVVGIIRHKLFS